MVTETLRLYSPVWVLPRQAAADVDLGGYQLPAGSRMLFSPYALNRDARLHREPGRFDPDRWAACDSADADAGVVLPVWAGHQELHRRGVCLAQSMLLLSAIAARWKLRLADGAAVSPVVSSTLVPSELPIIVTRYQERW